jgi:predicted O-methyltransferase YrrM
MAALPLRNGRCPCGSGMRYKECCGNLQGDGTFSKPAEFSRDWFTHNVATWSALLAEFRGRSGLRVLEIGVFEGRSTCWLLENIATGDGATLDCIDTFTGSMEQGHIDMAAVKARFEANTRRWKAQVTLHVGESARILPNLSGPYDIIYIDGSHAAADVLVDTVLAWRLAGDNAIIIFDDYGWRRYLDQPWLRPQMAVDAFLKCFAGWYQVLHADYQVIVRKLPAYQPPAPVEPIIPGPLRL